MSVVVGATGLLVLCWIAVTIGMSADTRTQHRARASTADERRRLNAERRELAEERERLAEARRRIAAERRRLEALSEARCRNCPLRRDR